MSSMFTGVLPKEPAAEYHARKGYISSSPLPEMAKSPLHFLTAWNEGVEPTPKMDNGTFMHDVLLELKGDDNWAPRPRDEAGRLIATNHGKYKEWLTTIGNKRPVEPELYIDRMDILSAACRSDEYVKAFDASDKEVSFYAKHPETGLYFKARLDQIAKDRSFLLDVKSTGDIFRFEKQIFTLGYDVRAVHYAETVRALEGVRIPEIYFFAMEQSRPYAFQMYRLSERDREIAEIKWRRWINEISVCMKENSWPGLRGGIIDTVCPPYLQQEDIGFEVA